MDTVYRKENFIDLVGDKGCWLGEWLYLFTFWIREKRRIF